MHRGVAAVLHTAATGPFGGGCSHCARAHPPRTLPEVVETDLRLKLIGHFAVEGRLAIIALHGGPIAEIDFRHVLARRQTITGSSLRPRSAAQKGAIAAALIERVWPLIAAGRIRPVISCTFALSQAGDAHRRLESGENVGKIVLTVGETL